MSDSLSYPEEYTDLGIMNRLLRHRLRNLCAGVSMTVDRIALLTNDSHPDLSGRCDIVKLEMERLQILTDRMDLLYEVLPKSRRASLFELVTELRAWFIGVFPCCNLLLDGQEEEIVFTHGSNLLLVFKELLQNAGEAAADCNVFFAWEYLGENRTLFRIVNKIAEPIAEYIKLVPPVPFLTSKSRHDGLGLSVVWRLIHEAGYEVSYQTDGKEFTVEIITNG